ncbi:hypothetical protein GGS23DRAFT_571377 [Durotheca rogersii]|uniref:uncharacterized protein n=1 Tax=Durotheca rogersii TaxID=419775 RepID=UPI00221EEE17|nr:uncharacterized protein GGS23DRAFT_571377 [Durotheca rogersii]KAI5862693.1 hypothetical protein GGS23DRAFT_571377 [Durotheca rogersii]
MYYVVCPSHVGPCALRWEWERYHGGSSSSAPCPGDPQHSKAGLSLRPSSKAGTGGGGGRCSIACEISIPPQNARGPSRQQLLLSTETHAGIPPIFTHTSHTYTHTDIHRPTHLHIHIHTHIHTYVYTYTRIIHARFAPALAAARRRDLVSGLVDPRPPALPSSPDLPCWLYTPWIRSRWHRCFSYFPTFHPHDIITFSLFRPVSFTRADPPARHHWPASRPDTHLLSFFLFFF